MTLCHWQIYQTAVGKTVCFTLLKYSHKISDQPAKQAKHFRGVKQSENTCPNRHLKELQIRVTEINLLDYNFGRWDFQIVFLGSVTQVPKGLL